ncbi:MAG TPA: hypothetical protein VF788_19570 [Pseudonocardiaceae bacterium]
MTNVQPVGAGVVKSRALSLARPPSTARAAGWGSRRQQWNCPGLIW